MLPATDEQRAALRSSTQTGGVRAVASYQGASVPVTLDLSGSVTFSASAEVQSAAQVTAVGIGDSLVPKSKTDPLATYGQELSIWRTVSVRGVTWEVPLGVFRINRAGDSFERFRGDTVLGWSVSLSLLDRFEMYRAGDFLSVEGPVSGNLVWDEIRRLALTPVQVALGDAAVPPATVYESRLDAVEVLASLLGGVPHLTREGVLTARRADAWLTETTPAFDIDGTIAWSDEMTSDFFNQVQVKSTNDQSIVAYAAITDDANPLSVNRAGPRTYRQSAPIYVDQAAAQAAADTILARVSTRRSRTVQVSCTPEALLLELGDFGWVRDPVQERAVLGEVSGIRISLDPTQPVSLDLIVAVEA
jgi:hypothetical protein